MNRLRCAGFGALVCAALAAGSGLGVGCGAQRPPGANSPGYVTVALSISSVKLLPGQSVTVTVKTEATRTLAGPITLELRPLEGSAIDGLSYAFEPPALQLVSGATGSSQLRIAALPTAEPREYKLQVVALADGTEENAPLSISTSGTSLGWHRQLGTSGSEVLSGMAADSQGGVYVIGYTTGGFNGQGAGGDPGTYDGFVLRYRRSGALDWVQTVGTTKSDVLTAIATDENDNVYVAGYTYGAMPGQTALGKADGFVAKLGSTGTLLWSRQVGTAEIDQLTALSIDAKGQVVAAGVTEGAFIGFGNKGKTDLFAVRLQSDGSVMWTQQIGSDQNELVAGVAVDGQEGASGAAYIVGGTEGALPDGSALGLSDAFLIKLGADGKTAWTRQVGSSNSDQFTAVLLDQSSSPTSSGASGVYVAGWTRGSFASQLQLGGQDALLVRYNAEGTRTLARQFGTSFTDALSGLTWVGNKLYSTGSTRGAFAGQDPLGSQDGFVARHNADGSVGWLYQFGTEQSDSGAAVAGLSRFDDVLYVGGTTYGAFEGSQLQGDSDGIVLQILPRPTP